MSELQTAWLTESSISDVARASRALPRVTLRQAPQQLGVLAHVFACCFTPDVRRSFLQECEFWRSNTPSFQRRCNDEPV